MRISVLSGKGGTGKTLISVNLAYAANDALYIDCDVEEPNGRIFLKPKLQVVETVKVMLPAIEIDNCLGCKTCVNFCKYNALAYVKHKLLIFPEICHACGGCVMLCPNNALTETKRTIGNIEYGQAGAVNTRTGVLNTGEATGVPVIRRLLTGIPKEHLVVIDCPPGSSCAVMESIKDSDYCVLVAEPTLFGVHNLSMVHELVKLFNKPHGVIINKAVEGETVAEDYCRENGLPILMEIPYDPEIGLLNSQGMLVAENDKYFNIFDDVLQKIKREVQHEATGCAKR